MSLSNALTLGSIGVGFFLFYISRSIKGDEITNIFQELLHMFFFNLGVLMVPITFHIMNLIATEVGSSVVLEGYFGKLEAWGWRVYVVYVVFFVLYYVYSRVTKEALNASEVAKNPESDEFYGERDVL